MSILCPGCGHYPGLMGIWHRGREYIAVPLEVQDPVGYTRVGCGVCPRCSVFYRMKNQRTLEPLGAVRRWLMHRRLGRGRSKNQKPSRKWPWSKKEDFDDD